MEIKIHSKIIEIGKEIWDNLNDGNPFTSYDYLNALEETNCLGAHNGWQVSHISISQDDEINGVCPLYLKYHSQGEYVFDYSWADAFENAGGQYYPKLLCAVPFTPVQSLRILAKNKDAENAIIDALKAICINNNISSVHINFPEPLQANTFEENGYLIRKDLQFWWENRDYNDFDDFLSRLSSSRRKSIKRERREVHTIISIKTIMGDEIIEAHMDKLYEFICDTYARKWGNGTPYLTREFFSNILQNMRDKIVLFFAYKDEIPIAGAINFLGDNILYGRQWGCLEDIDFLHFELCYYQAIEFAIKHKIKRVEAGTQGQHKLARGYLPNPVYSAHFIANTNFRNAIADFLQREKVAIENHINMLLETQAPFKSMSEN